MGDYQTPARMAKKQEAIPLPLLVGKTVLDIGCDHGAWCQLASELGASRVLGLDRGRVVRGHGFVDLVERNRAEGWPRCEFDYANVGKEWKEYGRFDVVFFFSVYHHVFAECGDHAAIWRWLRAHVNDDGLLIFEGPIDTRDGVARQRAKGHRQEYTRAAILKAAEAHFDVQHIGPALHRPHREVWYCRPHRGTGKVGDGGSVEGVPGERRSEDSGDRGAVRVAPAPRNAQRKGAGPGRRGKPARGAGGPDGAPDADRAAPVVASQIPHSEIAGDGRPDRPGGEDEDLVPRAGGAGRIALAGGTGRGSGIDLSDCALILGGAESVWRDLAALEALIGREWDGIVIAVNDVGCHFPRPLDHWVTLHPDKFQAWRRLRTENGYPEGYVTWAKRRQKLVDRIHGTWGGGSSGMFGATVARSALQVRLGVLCGVGMTRTPHFAQSTVHQPGKTWGSADAHWRAWKTHADKMRGWLRSMSGRSRDLLGEPTLEWFRGETEEVAA